MISNFAVTFPGTEASARQGLPYRLLDDYAPTWDHVSGGQKMILVCAVDDENVRVPPDARLHVAFDQTEVRVVSLCNHI